VRDRRRGQGNRRFPGDGRPAGAGRSSRFGADRVAGADGGRGRWGPGSSRFTVGTPATTPPPSTLVMIPRGRSARPEHVLVLADERHERCSSRSSSAAKKADAALKISFAQRSPEPRPQPSDLSGLLTGHPRPGPRIDLGLDDPLAQRLRSGDPQLRRDRPDRGILSRTITAVSGRRPDLRPGRSGIRQAHLRGPGCGRTAANGPVLAGPQRRAACSQADRAQFIRDNRRGLVRAPRLAAWPVVAG
jgi:hypothetical protein